MTICAPEIRCRGGLGAGNGVRFRPPSRLAARRGRDGTATGQIRAEDVAGREFDLIRRDYWFLGIGYILSEECSLVLFLTIYNGYGSLATVQLYWFCHIL